MRLERFIGDNFLTYDHVDYMIPQRPLLVQGRNLTEEDQASNGSGKSGIFTGIEFCITASNSRDVRDLELVTYGCDFARTQLYASCDVRKERIHIDWKIKVKGSNQLKLMKQKYNGEWEEISFSNVNDGKKYILAWFAITKEDLFNYYIINKTRFKSFFKTSNKEKVDLINRFSDASIVDGVENIDNSKLDTDFSDMEIEINKIDGKIEGVDENLTREKTRDFKEELKVSKEKIDEDIEDIEDEIEEIEGKVEKKKKELVELDEEIEENHSTAVIYENDKIPIKSKLGTWEALVETIEEEVEKAKELVDKFVSTDWNSKRKKKKESLTTEKASLEQAENAKDKEKEQETKILTFLQSIDVKLENSITCPKCEYEFVLDGDIEALNSKKLQGEKLKKTLEKKQLITDKSYKVIEASIKSINESLSTINDEENKENQKKNKLQESVNSISSKLNTQKAEVAKIEKEISAIDDKIKKLTDENKEIEIEKKGIDNEIIAFNKEIEKYKEEITQLKDDKKNLNLANNKAEVKRLNTERKQLVSDKEAKQEELQALGDKIFKRNQWSNNFKQFRMFLANQSLEAIEFHCNRYLAGMSSDLKVKLEGFKILANGNLKDEITAKIVRNIERSFSSFSGGEQGRLLFAGILANRHMINSTHPYGGLDFLSIDEVFEGVDGLGLKHLLIAAKQLEVSVMIITHVTDEEVNDDILLIEKVNGVSKIKN